MTQEDLTLTPWVFMQRHHVVIILPQAPLELTLLMFHVALEYISHADPEKRQWDTFEKGRSVPKEPGRWLDEAPFCHIQNRPVSSLPVSVTVRCTATMCCKAPSGAGKSLFALPLTEKCRSVLAASTRGYHLFPLSGRQLVWSKISQMESFQDGSARNHTFNLSDPTAL